MFNKLQNLKKYSLKGAMRKEDAARVFFLSILVFLMTFSALLFFGLIPQKGAEKTENFVAQTPVAPIDDNATQSVSANPVRIVISSINLDFAVITPESIDIETLDRALARGVVYYPEGGNLNMGNIFLFGHSSNLPVIRNAAYKVFTDLHLVKSGDIIQLFSEAGEYHYAVTKTFLADENEAFVIFSNDKKRLTLSTCNTFGAKSERFIVEAEFVEGPLQ